MDILECVALWAVEWERGGRAVFRVFDEEAGAYGFVRSAPRGMRDRIKVWRL